MANTSPKKVYAIAHQRGTSLPEALGELPAAWRSQLGRAAGHHRCLGPGAGWCVRPSAAEARLLRLRSDSRAGTSSSAGDRTDGSAVSSRTYEPDQSVCAMRTRSTPARTALRAPSPRCLFSWESGALPMIAIMSSRRSATARLINDPRFEPGVTLKFWNGVPFDRAVDMHADSETGGRPDARQARALESLTFRSLEYGPPPDEHWVDISYIDLKKHSREMRMPWRVVCPNRAPTAAGQGGSARMHRGIDPAAEAVRRAKKLMFNATLWKRNGHWQRGAPQEDLFMSKYEDFLSARTVETASGKFWLPSHLEFRCR